MASTIRKTVPSDIEGLKHVLDSIELFPSEMLDDMISDFFENPNSQDIWFTATDDNIPVGIGYCAPEKLTDGTYNLYAIGVKNDLQGKGIGRLMMGYLEELLSKMGSRVLIVETSGADAFELTRKFYEDLGYAKEAVIRDFWEDGDDKVIYWKKISG